VIIVLTGLLAETKSQLVALISLLVICTCWLVFSAYANSFYHAKIKAKIYTEKISGLNYIQKESFLGDVGVHRWVPIVFGVVPVAGILAAVILPTFSRKEQHFSKSSVELIEPGKENVQVIQSDNSYLALTESVKSLSKNITSAPPVPEFKSPEERLKYLAWLSRTSDKLSSIIPEWQIRKEFLQTVFYESKRAGLDPSIVLSLVSNLSGFNKYYVDDTGARGYMSVGTKWAEKIGDGNISSLFHMQTNLRYGCVVLRHYLDNTNGAIGEALKEYIASNWVLSVGDQRVVGVTKGMVLDISKWD
jgi:Transglycosylase SLT domain